MASIPEPCYLAGTHLPKAIVAASLDSVHDDVLLSVIIHAIYGFPLLLAAELQAIHVKWKVLCEPLLFNAFPCP